MRTRISVAFLSILLLVAGVGLGTTPALAAGNCSGAQRPAGATYSVEICIDAPSAQQPIAGDLPVQATVTVTVDAGGTNPGIGSVLFRMKGQGQPGLGVYLITDVSGTGTPASRTYGFLLPSYRWPDAGRTLIARAKMLDGFTTAPGATVNVQFQNLGVNPWTPQTFSPRKPTPQAGQPLVVTAVGDGAIDNQTAHDVSSEVAALNPDMFLYLADVYNVGSLAEFYNWYGPPPGTPACPQATGCGNWGQFYTITNPNAGVHEYNSPPVPGQPSGTVESGYTDYWGMATGPDDPAKHEKHYYSYNAGGWHFISLDSTDAFRASSGWSDQYNWLVNNLENTHDCTIAYWHHPYWGMKTQDENGVPVAGGVDVRLTDMYQAMFDHGVDILLTGHQHNFQRWKPLDPSGAVNQNYGITEIVDGAGGHPFGYYTRTDSRLASGIDRSGDAFQNGQDVGPSPNGNPAGVIQLKLYNDHADYTYVLAGGTHKGEPFDSATIPCHAAPTDHTAPAAPIKLQGTAGSSSVDLNWTPPSDNDIAGYNIFRATGAAADCSVSCVQIGTTNSAGTAFTDTKLNPSTAYTYGVRARDTSGNASPMSDSILVATSNRPPLFSDDFEGTGSGCAVSPSWTKVITRLVPQPEPGNPGNCEGFAPSTGQNVYASKTLSAPQSDLYAQERFKVMSQSSTVSVMRLKNTAGAVVYTLSVGQSGRLNVRNDLQKTTTTTGLNVGPTTGWHTVTVHLSIGATDHADVWLDGNSVLSKDDVLGSSLLSSVTVGENVSGRTFQLELDDVKVASAAIPP